MSAKEMFEELEGVFSVTIKKTHYTGYGEGYNYQITLNFVDSQKDIFFDDFYQTYTVYNNRREITGVKAEYHNAIGCFIKELGWDFE